MGVSDCRAHLSFHLHRYFLRDEARWCLEMPKQNQMKSCMIFSTSRVILSSPGMVAYTYKARDRKASKCWMSRPARYFRLRWLLIASIGVFLRLKLQLISNVRPPYGLFHQRRRCRSRICRAASTLQNHKPTKFDVLGIRSLLLSLPTPARNHSCRLIAVQTSGCGTNYSESMNFSASISSRVQRRSDLAI